MNKTYVVKKENIEKNWYVIDAKGQVLGRLSTKIANILRGKQKPIFTPHLDLGDFVIVINASEVVVSGKKGLQKRYLRHSGQPGGLKVENFQQLQTRLPNRILEKAVKGMLPKGALGRQIFKKLKVYPGSWHPHEAQKPITLND